MVKCSRVHCRSKEGDEGLGPHLGGEGRKQNKAAHRQRQPSRYYRTVSSAARLQAGEVPDHHCVHLYSG